MKKNIMFAMLIFFFPLIAFADSVNLTCPDEIANGSEITCEIRGNSNLVITDLEMRINYSSGLSFVSFTKDSVWQGDNDDVNVQFYSQNGSTGNFKIGTLKLKHNSGTSNTVSVTAITFYPVKGDNIVVPTASKTISVKQVTNNIPSQDNTNNKTNNTVNNNNSGSNNTTSNAGIVTADNNSTVNNDNDEDSPVTNIVVDGYNLNFDPHVYSYTLEIGNEDSLSITPILDDNGDTFEIIGNESLDNGSTIRVEVATADDDLIVYTINILKNVVTTGTENKKNYSLYFIIVIAVLLIVNVLRLLLKNKQPKGNDEV